MTDTSTKFEFVPDVCVVFISTFDIFDGGLPLYHVDRIVRETKQIIENGFTEIYVNSVHYDGSKTAKFMKLFTENDIYDSKEFPVTSEIKARYKTTENGAREMSGVIDKLIKENVERAEKRGSENQKLKIAKDMKKEGLTDSLIMKLIGLSMDKIMAL